MSGIDITNLVKIYDNGYRAVKGIDLQIRDREFMVLVGPSGCGKTTTLRMIAGLETVSGGEIRLGGKRINETAPKNRDIAMVFQSYALYPHLTVYDNLAFALKLRKVPKATIHEQVMEAARLLNLGEQLGKLPKQLSGGQRQRVALGRAIVRKPQAYLFDEPLSNLDAKLRASMRYELRTMQQRLATTAVYVTHDQIEAMTLGDRITVMSVGEIQQVAKPTTVYDFPFNRFVAGFIGTPAMNFLTGRLVQSAGRWSFQLPKREPIALAMANQGRFIDHAGMDLVLGVRPEHLHAAGFGPAPGSPGLGTLRCKIDVIEHMGDHQYVYLVGDGIDGTLIMKAPAEARLDPGQDLPIGLDTTRAHVFAGTDEHAENITLPAGFAQQQ